MRCFVPILLLALTLTGCGTVRQPDGRLEIASRQDAELMAYNVGFGAVVGAVGAAINGDRGTVWERAGRGALVGAAGGTGLYAGKWMTGQIYADESLAWGWPALLVHETGASVVENAALDRPPLSRLSLHAGIVRLDVRPLTREVKARLLPLNTLAVGLMLADHRLDLARTAALGTPIFSGEEGSGGPLGVVDPPRSFALLNSVYLQESPSDERWYYLVAHEMVHVLQHREYLRAGTLHARLDDPLQDSGLYRSLSEWIYLDNPAAMGVGYVLIEGIPDGYQGCYFDNWYEHEADAFARRERVPC
ncbi:MAG: hypothetical protein AAGI52_02245 [Bacteroidota bacterium]